MIRVSNATKIFGTVNACSEVSFEVHPGEITALLGPNGAGKTTILKMISGVLFPSQGDVYVAGRSTIDDPVQARQNTGTVFENVPLYGNLTVREQLSFIAGMYGISRKDIPGKLRTVIASCMLEEVSERLIRNLSRGFRQRTGLALALVHDPAVLVLDEPTNGLDPVQLAEFRTLMRSISPNRTILFSTHIMQEVESLCSRVVMLNRGKLIAQGTITEICDRTGTGSIEEAFVHLVAEKDESR